MFIGLRALTAAVALSALAGCGGIKQPLHDASAALDKALGVESSQAPQQQDPAAVYRAALELKRSGQTAAAAEAFRRAADAGYPAAAYELGLAYGRGEGVGQDERRAAEFLGRAATAGHPQAQFLLGEAFYQGRGVPLDRDWAARWYGKAAYQGYAKAQLAYGAMWVAGAGTPKNAVEAYRWLSLAAAAGDQQAARMREALGRRMTALEIARAEQQRRPAGASESDRLGDRPTIIYVQRALVRAGYDPGAVDGLLGPRTRAAIRAFQSRVGMTADGRVTAALLESLLAGTRTAAIDGR